MTSRSVILFSFALAGSLLLSGCEDNSVEEPDVDWGDWVDDSVDPNAGYDEEEVIRDTAYRVIDKRQAGGGLYDDPSERGFDGEPLRRRQPIEYMIVVEGNRTGQQSAYLLPESDFTRVRVGHRLEEATLSRWESTAVNHIPPQQTPSDSDDTGIGRVREQRSPFDPTYDPF